MYMPMFAVSRTLKVWKLVITILISLLFANILRENTLPLSINQSQVLSKLWKSSPEKNLNVLQRLITGKTNSESLFFQFAFDFALREGRKKVTCVHKANIMKKGDGMFMRSFYEVAKDYPMIEANDLIVDNTCMQLVSHPHQFDVMVSRFAKRKTPINSVNSWKMKIEFSDRYKSCRSNLKVSLVAAFLQRFWTFWIVRMFVSPRTACTGETSGWWF